MVPKIVNPISKGIPMKISTSRLAWVKACKKSIDMLGNLCILDIANNNLTLIVDKC